MNWHKLMFVLPNLFTVSSIFCGFYSMTLSQSGEFTGAAIAIFFAVFFDCFDGRVARLTKTQSEFGVELDSLADVMSFGLAPALLVYLWMLQPLGMLGLFIAFAFATCGALRLARFNVLAHRKIPGSSKFFVGLPIPLGAGMIVALVLAHESGPLPLLDRSPWGIALIVLLLAALMVSNVRYRTFKDMKFSRKSAGSFLALILFGLALAVTILTPPLVLLLYFSGYLSMGLIEGVISVTRRRWRPLPAPATAAAISGGGPLSAAGSGQMRAADEGEEDGVGDVTAGGEDVEDLDVLDVDDEGSEDLL